MVGSPVFGTFVPPFFFGKFMSGWKPTKKLSPSSQSDWTLVLEFSWRKSWTTFRAKDYNISLPSIPRNLVFLHSFVSKSKNIVVLRNFSYEVLKIFISNEFWRKLKTFFASLPELFDPPRHKHQGKQQNNPETLCFCRKFLKNAEENHILVYPSCLNDGFFKNFPRNSAEFWGAMEVGFAPSTADLKAAAPRYLFLDLTPQQSSGRLSKVRMVGGRSKVGGVCTEVVSETQIFGTSTVL